MLPLRWGKQFKHNATGVIPNTEKAAVRGSALAIVDVGLMYWERRQKQRDLDFFLKST